MQQQSKLEQYRAERENRESGRRTAMIDVAEEVFLERGIAATTMMDIADRAGVSRVTLYRYFAERDHISYMVAGRMLGRLTAAARAGMPPGAKGLDALRAGFLALVASFDENQDAHRFLAMFDATIRLRKHDREWERWYRLRARRAWSFDDEELFPELYDAATINRLITLVNAVLGVLGRLAMWREAITQDNDVDLQAQLENLADLTSGYFDSRIAPHVTVVPRK